jgi:hypothetical protein
MCPPEHPKHACNIEYGCKRIVNSEVTLRQTEKQKNERLREGNKLMGRDV